jgi:hypothetical protein
MKPWLYRHRQTIYALYILLATTAILILQALDSTGRLP